MDPNNSWFVKKHFQVPCQFVWGTLHMLNWLKWSSIKTILPTLIACDKKSSATEPFFCAKKLDAMRLGTRCRDFGAQRCLLSIGNSKNPVVQTAIVKNPCSEKHESQLRDVFHKSANMFMTMFFLFVFKGDRFFPLKLSHPGFFLKKISSILTGVSMMTLGHLFQHLGHLRRSLRMGFRGGFSEVKMVYIIYYIYIYIILYIYDQQPLLLKQRYIYIYVF